MKPIQVLFLILSTLSLINCSITFSGDCSADFESVMTSNQFSSWNVSSNSTSSGFDITMYHLYYDYSNDTLYVCVECAETCGLDSDDNTDYCSDMSSWFLLGIWPNIPSDYWSGEDMDSLDLWPSIVTGVNPLDCLSDMTVRSFPCMYAGTFGPCEAWDDPFDGYWGNSPILSNDLMPFQPTTNGPNLEFRITHLSELYGFNFIPGDNDFTFAVSIYTGNSILEVSDRTEPMSWTVECVDKDSCGVCNGDNSTCSCSDYLGFCIDEVNYSLLKWSNSAIMTKLNETICHLEDVKNSLPLYDYQSNDIVLSDFVDDINSFKKNCLNDFNTIQMWFADVVAGNIDSDLGQPDWDSFEFSF